MAFASDAQRRWFWANFGDKMSGIARKMATSARSRKAEHIGMKRALLRKANPKEPTVINYETGEVRPLSSGLSGMPQSSAQAIHEADEKRQHEMFINRPPEARQKAGSAPLALGEHSALAGELGQQKLAQQERFKNALHVIPGNAVSGAQHVMVVEQEGAGFRATVWGDNGRQRLWGKTYASERAALRGAAEFEYGKSLARRVIKLTGRERGLDKGRGIPRGPSVFEITAEGLAAESAATRRAAKVTTYKTTRKGRVVRVTVPPSNND